MLAPTVAATHWTAYYVLDDDYIGETLEDDGAVINRPGNRLHGVANVIVPPGSIPGDGSRFLDARVGNQIGSTGNGEVGVDFYAGEFATLAGADPRILLPGARHVSAWYGEWIDLNDDGVIGDVHDAAADGADEFTWRGIGSGEGNVALIFYILPHPSYAASSTEKGPRPPGMSAYPYSYERNLPNENYWPMVDATNQDNLEQGWLGRAHVGIDGGLLATIQTFVIADATKNTGSDPGYELGDPTALYDVDIYPAMSNDVESLWRSTITTYAGASIGPLPSTGTLAGELVDLALDTVGDARSIAESGGFSQIIPPYSKEPNTYEDDFEGRATFGGVGDYVGSRNDYAGYADVPHLYLDVLARTPLCAGAYGEVPGVTSTSATAYCPAASHARNAQGTTSIDAAEVPMWVDPVGAQGEGRRTAGTLLTFEAFIFLWRDGNRDNHVGTVCDHTNTSAFDAETNACRDPPYPWPGISNSETIDICATAHAAGRTFTLSPIGGSWSNVIVARDYAEASRQAFTSVWEPVSGSAPIVLRWESNCRSTTLVSPKLASRDALVFLEPAAHAIRVESTVSLDKYENTGQGISIGPEYVTDVDYLTPTL